MEGELFLGKVSINGPSWARLEPLAIRTSGQWTRIENAVETFPTQGKVFSTRPLLNAPPNSLWTFTQRPNERPNGPDLLIAEDIVRATPIVDLSAISLEMARRRLVVQGVSLTIEFNSVTAVVLLIDDLFCEVSLIRSEDGLWRSGSFTRPVQLKETPKGWDSPLDFNGLRVLPVQFIPNGQVIRTINWCSDQDFVERVIERFRKFMMNVGDTSFARPSKDTVKYIARALRRADLVPEEENDILLDMERLQADWPILEERFDASEELGSFILGLKSTKQKIDAAVEGATRQAAEAARPQIERQVREEAETLLAEARLQVDALSREVENLAQRRAQLTQDLKDLEERSAESREQQKAISESVKLVAKDMRAALAQSPQQERATLAYIAERLEMMLNEGGYSVTPLLPPVLPPWAAGLSNLTCTDIGYDVLSTRICEEAKRHAVEEHALRLVDLFARAGELVVLCGPQSELALQAYARCVSGGVYRAMAVDPSVIGLDDLWRAPGTQSPTAFAHAWQAALSEPEHLHIVCLRDFDAAPYALWLASFQAVLQSSLRPTNLLVFASTTGRSDTQNAVMPNDDNLSSCLVPVFPGVHAAGAASALDSVIPPIPSPSRLSIGPEAEGNEVHAGSWLGQVVALDLPPSVLSRLAKFTNRFDCDDPNSAMADVQSWGRFLVSKQAANLASCLKDGYAALAN